MDITVKYLSELLGEPEGSARFALILYGSIPLCLLYQLLDNPFLRHLYGVILGSWVLHQFFSYEIIYVWLQILISYGIVLLCNRKYVGKILFLESMAYLSFFHIRQMLINTSADRWQPIDLPTCLMIITQKLHSFGFSYQDGCQSESKLNNEQQQLKIIDLPNFFEFYSYIVFYPTIAIGPSIEYSTFINFIKKSNNYHQIQYSGQRVLLYLFFGIIFMIISVGIFPYFPISKLADQQFGQENSLLYKIFYMNLVCYFIRIRYYIAFCVAQSAVHACGLSYNSSQPESFDYFKSVCLEGELEYNPKKKVEMWNPATQIWLRRYVYGRIYDKQTLNSHETNIASYATYAISAVWHGFYIQYYFCFLYGALINNVNKLVFKYSLKNPQYFEFQNIIFIGLKYIIPNTILNYAGDIFQMKSLQEIFIVFYQVISKFSSNLNYSMEICLLGSLFIFSYLNTQKSKQK